MKRINLKIGWLLLALPLLAIAGSNIYHRYLRSAFTKALMSDDVGAVQRLLGWGVSPNEQILQDYPLFITLSRYQKQRNPMMPVFERVPACEEIALSLIKHGANIEVKRPDNLTPLLYAIQVDARKVVRELLDRHANLKAKDNLKNTALHLACTYSKREVVQWLLVGGCDVNAVNQFGYTPLTIAAQGSKPLTAQLLVEHGANIHIPDQSGQTPLFTAVAAGNSSDKDRQKNALQTAQYLLSKGADPRTPDKQGQTVATMAGYSPNMLEVLGKMGIPFPAHGTKEEGVLFQNAVSSGNLEIAMRCRTAIPKLEDNAYLAALRLAQQKDDQTFLNLLLPYLNAKRYSLYLSPGILNSSVKEGRIEQMIRTTPLPLSSEDWQKLLSQAITTNRLKIVNAILEKGVPVEFQDWGGRTPLIGAVLTENTEMVKTILAHRPDVNRKSRGGTTALYYAKRTKRTEIVRLLETAGAKD